MNDEAAVSLLREQKHDLFNYFQVVDGYLQMGKVDKARGYLARARAEIETRTRVLRLNDAALALALYTWQARLLELGTELFWQVENPAMVPVMPQEMLGNLQAVQEKVCRYLESLAGGRRLVLEVKTAGPAGSLMVRVPSGGDTATLLEIEPPVEINADYCQWEMVF